LTEDVEKPDAFKFHKCAARRDRAVTDSAAI
jgi:hypothetical protein